jgi:hypothetical protein
VKKRNSSEDRRRSEDTIKMDLKETVEGCGIDLSGSGQSLVAGCCEPRPYVL